MQGNNTTDQMYKNHFGRSDFIGVSELKQLSLIKSMTRDYIRQLKNPELQFNGEPVPLDQRGPVRSTKKFDQLANPMAAMRGNHEANLSSASIDKPKFEIDNSYNVMLLTGAATDTRTIVESFL